MAFTEQQEKRMKEVFEKWIASTFSSAVGLKKLSKALIKEMQREEKRAKRAKPFEMTFVEKFVSIAKEDDAVWMDLRAADVIKKVEPENNKIAAKLSTTQLGKALTKKGAKKKVKNGIAYYQIKKIKTKKLSKLKK